MKVYQFVLRGDRSSERGIRYRRLKPSEVDDLRLKAAQLVAAKQLPAEQAEGARRATFLREGIKAMLVAVTKQPVPRPELPPKVPGPLLPDGSPGPEMQPAPVEPPLAEDALWQNVDIGTLTMPGPFNYDEVFEAPDDFSLKAIFIFNHESNFEQIDSIVKKERAVSTG